MRDPSEVIAAIVAEMRTAKRHSFDTPTGDWGVDSTDVDDWAARLESLTTPQPASADVVDARRYRWLRENNHLSRHDVRPVPYAVISIYWRVGRHQARTMPGGKEGLDAAIDAAMAPTKEPT